MASERLGASFSIDVTNLKAGLTQANRLIRESESEFKAAAAGLDDWTKSEEGVTAKIRSLNDITDVQKKKVAALKEEYQRLIDNGLDPASREAVQLRTQINNEEAALKSNEKALAQQQEALKNVGKETDAAADKTSKFADVAKAAGKVAAAAFAAAGAAVGALLKSSIEGYAEYEQLVGGVDTLFKDASGKLQAYAADAYKTAGLSANEYMANVTSFSAALISSLGGDTDKAADVADRAMRDMSDNANKMGTDMQSIIDTYQSLSRGNFQMLDNLKLGYGGTKTEMERLIADAAKLTDVQDELNLSVVEGDMSFSNMVNAISVVQKQMGITGTTAKEASTTIKGSISAMKSAWSNLATGMADDNADLDQLINNFVDSVGTAAENLIPRITIAMDGILRTIERLIPLIPPLIAEFLPVIIDGIMGLLDGVVEVLPTVIDAIMEVVPQLITLLIAMLPTLTQTIVSIIVQIVSAIAEMIPTIVDAVMEVLPLLVQSLVDAIPQLLQAAIEFMMAIVQAIPTIITALIENIPFIIDTIISVLLDNLPILLDGAITLLMAIVDAIPTIIEALIENLPMIIETILTELLEAIPQIIDAAIQLFLSIIEAVPVIIEALVTNLPLIIETIVNGLVNAIPMIIDAAIQLMMAILEAIPVIIEALVTNLPSIITTIIDTLVNNIPALIDGAIQLFMAIVQAIPEFLPELIAKLPEIITAIVEGLLDGMSSIIDVGRQIVEGVWEGIKNAGEWLSEKVSGFFSGIVDGVKNFLGIASPSKLFEDVIGRNMALGIGVGFDDEMKDVNKQITNAIKLDGVGINAQVASASGDYSGGNSRSVVINQTNNYSQAHSRYELYKSKQQTFAAVQLALTGV